MQAANEQVQASELTAAPGVPTPAQAPLLLAPPPASEQSSDPVEAPKLAEAPQLAAPVDIVAAPAMVEALVIEAVLTEPTPADVPVEATMTIAAPAVALDPIPTLTIPVTPPVIARNEPAIRIDATRAAPGSAPDVVPPVKESPAKSERSPRAGRFGLLAASIALAAGIGAAGGAAGFAGLTNMMAPTPASAPVQAAAVQPRPESADEIKALKDSIAHLRGNLKTVSDGVAALRASSDNGGKAAQAQLAKLGEAIERLERAQAEPNARLAKLTDAVDRMDRRPAATTAASHPVPAPETTGSIKPPPLPPLGGAPNAGKPILEGWNLLRVQGGVALVDSRYGAVEVEVGDDIRGAGRVQEIRRQDGRWMVVTNRGLIVAAR